MPSSAVLLFMRLITTASATTCYYQNGDVANDDVPCGSGTNYCCPIGDTCVSDGTHALCRDANNHVNGSLTYLSGQSDPGLYNYTGLYKSTSCDNTMFNGCSTYCLTAYSRDEYVWACDDSLSTFCCHRDDTLFSQRDCCDDKLYTISTALSAFGASATSTSTQTSTTASASGAGKTSYSSSSTGDTLSLVSTRLLALSSSSTTSTIQSSAWASSLVPLSPSSVLEPTSTQTSFTSSVSASTSATPSVSWSDLSSGTKIGIGVATVAVLLLGLGVFLLWKKLRANRQLHTESAETLVDTDYVRDMKGSSSLQHPLRCPSCVSHNHQPEPYGTSLLPPDVFAIAPSPSPSPSPPPPQDAYRQPFLQELPDSQLYEMPAGRGTWYRVPRG